MWLLRAVAFLVLFLAIAVAAPATSVQGWDRAVTVWLQQAAPAPDVPAVVWVFLGDAEILIPAVALAALALRGRDPRRARRAGWVALGLVVVSALAFGLKFLIPHPGPPFSLQRHVIRAGLGIPEPYSFPSGHTMRTAFLGGTLLRRTSVLAGALIVTMMAALVYLGDHWMTDVLGGFCLGWTCAEAAHDVLGRLT